MSHLWALKDELERRRQSSVSRGTIPSKAVSTAAVADHKPKERRAVFAKPNVVASLKPVARAKHSAKRKRPEKLVDVEEQRALEKSKTALNKKAKLYEDLHSGSMNLPEHAEEACLVDFNRKAAEQPYSRPVIVETSTSVDADQIPFNQRQLVSEDMWREDRRKKWEEEVDPNAPVHYQQVLGEEIRDHGVAYFKFSTDETKRQEEMMELNTLRMQTRISRVNKGFADAATTGRTDEPEENISKATKPRPWDADKPKPSPMPSWQQRLESARADRPDEFAPPASYYK